MPHLPSDVLSKLDKQAAIPSTTAQQDASKTIFSVVSSGRSVVGVIATTSNATNAVISAAIDELVLRQTRVIRMGQAKVSCLGPALAMDHLRINEMQINGGSVDRSKQIVQGLQLLGQPVPDEKRRLLVIEDAEGVDPALLENLARMPGLSSPTLPLQLLYVGSTAYWERLSGMSDGVARRLIGSPMILLQAPGETETVAASPAATAESRHSIREKQTSEKARRSKWMFTGLVFLAGGALAGLGVTNHNRIVTFVTAHYPQVRNDAEPSTKLAVMNNPTPVNQKSEPDHTISSDIKAPDVGDEHLATKPGTVESAERPEAAPSTKAVVNYPALSDSNDISPKQAKDLQPSTSVPVLNNIADSKTISMSMSRGDTMLALHDFAAARRYYELAAKAGSSNAALALARTYDPTTLAKSGPVSAEPDAKLATDWYRKASALGSSEAEIALRNLARQSSN